MGSFTWGRWFSNYSGPKPFRVRTSTLDCTWKHTSNQFSSPNTVICSPCCVLVHIHAEVFWSSQFFQMIFKSSPMYNFLKYSTHNLSNVWTTMIKAEWSRKWPSCYFAKWDQSTMCHSCHMAVQVQNWISEYSQSANLLLQRVCNLSKNRLLNPNWNQVS